jgi:two-component system CheB/CheR fusion protein
MHAQKVVSTGAVRPLVVGIGASAGGLEALRQVVPALSRRPDVAYVLLQHMSPAHRSLMVEILSPLSDLPVFELTDGMAPRAGALLVTPPNAHVRLDGGRLRLLPADAHPLPRPGITLFFDSLAHGLGERAGGLILSGTGSDGADGLASIQAAGGMVLVQAVDSARYTGMPEAALARVGSEHEVTLEDLGPVLADQLAARLGPPPLVTDRHSAPASSPSPVADAAVAVDGFPASPRPDGASGAAATRGDDPHVEHEHDPDPDTDPLADAAPRGRLFRRLRELAGIDLDHYKPGTVGRRLRKRMHGAGTPDLNAYLDHIETHPEELEALATDLLIGVTAFWRDPQAYEALLTALAEAPSAPAATPAADGPVRAWVAGCSTGEEAYSVAIALGEALAQHHPGRGWQVFATDLSELALVQARRGVYPLQALAPLGEARIARWFTPTKEGMEVRAALREHVVFSRHDLTRDAPFPRMDLVTCRNVLIYLKPAAQERAFALFAYALRAGGLLLLGRSESTVGVGGHFDIIDKPQRLYRRNQLPRTPGIPGGPRRAEGAGAPLLPGTDRDGTARHRAPSAQERLFAHVARHEVSGAMLLDGRGRLLHLHGEVGPVFGLNPGEQRLDLAGLVRPEFAAELRLLAAPELLPGERRTTLLQTGTARRRQRWQLALSRDEHGEQLLTLRPLTRAERPATADPDGDELPDARRRLRELVEQLESSNEEMQALNEEAQATNEELQSSNEELEASNEELQATNQELATVNAELGHQWQVYRHLSEELVSVLQSIGMPVIVLGEDLCLQRFNAAAADLFGLDPGSTGRHIDTMRLPEGMAPLGPRLLAFGASASPLSETLPPLADGRRLDLHLSHRIQDRRRNGIVMTLSDHTRRAAAERAVQSLEQRMLGLLEHGRGLIAIKDTQGRYEYANERYAAFLGLTRGDLVGRTDRQALPEPLAHALRDRDLEALRAHDGTEHEEVVPTGAGQRVWWANRFVLRDAEGTPTSVCIQAIDTTLAHQEDEQRRISARVLDVTSEGVMITNADHEILRVNRAFTRITGHDAADVVGRPAALLRSDRHDDAFHQRLWDEVARSGGWSGEVWKRRRDGQDFPQWLTVSALKDESGTVTHYVSVFSDISALVDSRERLERMATQDPLTGLPNRRMLLDRLEQAVARAARQRGELALCFVDLDNFKTINDSLGHEAGDDLLKEIARRLADSLRVADTVARLGGDEFVIMLESTTRHETLQTVERVQRALSGTLRVRGQDMPCSVSVGIAMYPGDGEEGPVLMQHADAAMYRAKHDGKGRYEFFSQEAAADARHRLRLEIGLREAVQRNQFRLVYQPQFALQDGTLVGVEALLRWQPDAGRMLAPSAFLKVAEESSLIESIGRWVLNEALRQHAAWRDQGAPDFSLSVNVSARQLRHRGFVDEVQQALYAHRVPGRLLVLEITETSLLATGAELDALLARLRALEVRISLDDFGTGYSSLARLRQLPLHELKIDRGFIAGLADDRSDREIVAAVLGMARALQLRVVAEGVETTAQREHLLAMEPGVVGQGYLLGRPAPAEARPWISAERMQEVDA